RAVLGGASIEDHLVNLVLDVVRQHDIENAERIWLENITEHGIDIFAVFCVLVFFGKIKTADWKQCLKRRFLADRVDKVRVKDGDFVDIPAKEFLEAEPRERLGFDKARCVFQLEIGQ